MSEAIRCTNCGETKPAAQFWRSDRRHHIGRGGRSGWCSPCAGNRRTQYEMLPDDHPSIASGTRACSGCGVEKPLVDFGRTRFSLLGRQYQCRSCFASARRCNAAQKPAAPSARDYGRQYRHGVSAAAFKALFDSQRGRCAICKSELDFMSKDTCVDHDHATGVIRGVLCSRCNLGLGHMRDDPALLEAALSYLRAQRKEVA